MPKYVIVNNTAEKLLVTQESLDEDFIILDAYARENFRWLNSKAPKKVMIKVLDSNAEDPIHEWKWSSPFILEEVGSNNIRNPNNKKSNTFMYWKIDRRIQNVSIIVSSFLIHFYRRLFSLQ